MPEILNIISESILTDSIGGPQKVILNTIKGLKKIGYPYVMNQNPSLYRLNWIHDSAKGLIEVSLNKIPALIGPNIAVLPKDLPGFRASLTHCIYLHPSQWCIDLWKLVGFKECPLIAWPAGIDIESFKVSRNAEAHNNVMIYFKRRNAKLLKIAIETLNNLGYNPLVIKYGNYDENQYKKILANTAFGVWIGISESQGIGLQEALASDLPLIVLDVPSLFESSDKKDYEFPNFLSEFIPTSVPYFDERCGIIINDITQLNQAIKQMGSNLSDYKPAEYIKENLSLDKQASELISLFNNIGTKGKKYSSISAKKNSRHDFRLSLHGHLIFVIFVFVRKLRTMFKLLKM